MLDTQGQMPSDYSEERSVQHMKENRGFLIAISIIIGIVLSCSIVPLGFAFLLMTMNKESSTELLPAKAWKEQVISGSGSDRILIVHITGIIGNGSSSNLFSDELNHTELLSQLRQAAQDPFIKAVVLRVDSPGGGVVASNEIHQAITKIRDAEKKIVVSMGTMAASGGYYVSTPADKIYANPDTLTGSLGVIITSVNYQETFEKVGLRQVVYKSGKFKDILSPARESTAEEQQIIQSFIDEAYQGFVDVIAEGRDIPRKEVLDLADGRIYSGRQALKLGLVDEMGGLEEAIEGAKELAGLSDGLVVRYHMSNSFSDLLVNQVEKSQQPNDPLGLRQVLEPQPPKVEYRLPF